MDFLVFFAGLANFGVKQSGETSLSKSRRTISSITLIKKLINNKNETNKYATKNSHECGKTDITGRANSDAQPSRVKVCNKANNDAPKVENSINTPPNKLTPIMANT